MAELEDNDERKLLLASARMSINFGVTVFVILTLVVCLTMISPNLFPHNPEISVAEEANITPVSIIDSADIVNGIHVPSGLIADKGLALVVGVCGNCHSIDLVKQNRATKSGWKEMIVWMQKTQGLWDLGAKEEPILVYLAKNYGPIDTGRRKNLTDIEWYQLEN
jgi:hypothetical protein